MAVYKYIAISDNSKKKKGSLEATDPTQLATLLKQNNLFLSSFVEDAGKEVTRYKIKTNELSEFSKEIGTMLSAGVTVIRAIDIMLNRDIKPALKGIYSRLIRSLQQGNQLSSAMELENGAFPELMINMFRAGEQSGRLDKTAQKMAVHFEKEYKLQNKIKNAMVYPIFLVVALIVVILAVFTLILPKFFVLFDGIELPTVTKVVMAISDLIINKWIYLLLGLFIIIALCTSLVKIPAVATEIDKLKLKIPKIGKLLKIIYTARFSRTLSSLYSSGLSIVEAMSVSSGILGNKYLQSQFGDVKVDLLNGNSLSDSISKIDGFDTKLTSTVLIGEETGKLDDMLESIADSFDYEADTATTKLVTLIEPIFIIVMAVVVGFVILSVLLPILTIYQNVG